MARMLVPIDTCDLCKKQGLPNSEAARSIGLAIDGPPKRYELCPPHIAQLSPFAELYNDDEYGVDEAAKPKPRQKTETPLQPELEPVRKPKNADEPTVVCPLQHRGGKGNRIKLSNRSGHADAAHDGLRVWDIAWEDPDGVLTAPCTTHAECEKTGLSFPTERSLVAHIRSCTLPRIA